MARLYETKNEQFARELADLYAGRPSEPAAFPPRTRRRRSRTARDPLYVTNEDLVVFPRYQSTEQQYRKVADAAVRSVRHFRRVTGGFTGT